MIRVLLLWSLMQILLKNVSTIKLFTIFFYNSTAPLIFFSTACNSNCETFGVSIPQFYCAWNLLFKRWTGSVNGPQVQTERDKRFRRKLSNFTFSQPNPPSWSRKCDKSSYLCLILTATSAYYVVNSKGQSQNTVN